MANASSKNLFLAKTKTKTRQEKLSDLSTKLCYAVNLKFSIKEIIYKTHACQMTESLASAYYKKIEMFMSKGNTALKHKM